MSKKIIVLDYGSQYNQLISRRIREIGVFSELKSHKISAAEVSLRLTLVGIIPLWWIQTLYNGRWFILIIDPEIF